MKKSLITSGPGFKNELLTKEFPFLKLKWFLKIPGSCEVWSKMHLYQKKKY